MGNAGSGGLAYTHGEKVSDYAPSSGWELYHGKSNSDGAPVSIFRFNKKLGQPSEKNMASAQNMLKYTKTLRHPHTLNYLDSADIDREIILVTEPVMPLFSYLEKLRSYPDDGTAVNTPDSVNGNIAWGLYCLLQALGFMNNDCKLVHGNVCPESIFVTRGGDFKLGGFNLVGPLDPNGPCQVFMDNLSLLKSKYQPPERLKNSWRDMNSDTCNMWSIDIFSLGCVIYEAYNGEVSSAKSLLDVSKLPPTFHKAYKLMLASSPGDRVNPTELPQLPGCKTYFQHPFIMAMLFMGEIQILPDAQKADFFKDLPTLMVNFPLDTCRYKVLPIITSQLSFLANQMTNVKPGTNTQAIGALSSLMLTPMLQLGTKLNDEEEYKRVVLPTVLALFASNDRATRVALLQRMDEFVEHLSNDLINTTIFEHLCTGFTDTAPILREVTIKGVLHLAPKLSAKNLNDKLIRYFIRLQSDAEPAIRTNSIICLGRILEHFSAAIKKQIVSTYFPKAVLDQYKHTRIAGLRALAATHALLAETDPALLAGKVLGGICVATADPEPDVRQAAFSCVNAILKTLLEASNKRTKEQEETAKLNVAPAAPQQASANAMAAPTGGTATAAKWTTSLVSQSTSSSSSNNNNSSKVLTPTKRDPEQRRREAEERRQRREEAKRQREAARQPKSLGIAKKSSNTIDMAFGGIADEVGNEAGGDGWNDDDGWNNDDDDLLFDDTPIATKPKGSSLKLTPSKSNASMVSSKSNASLKDADPDDFFSSQMAEFTSSGGKGNVSQRTKGSKLVINKAKKPLKAMSLKAQKKASKKEDDINWDEW